MDDVLCKIRALHATNCEIIERLESLETTTWYTYTTRSRGKHNVTIVEEAHSMSTQTILDEWSTGNDMESNLLSLGNESLTDLSAPALTWESMKYLNSEMVEEVEDLAKLLDRSPDNAGPETELRKYLHNYEKLQVAFGDLEEKTMSRPSRKSELMNEAKLINKALNDMSAKMLMINKSRKCESAILSGEEYCLLEDWYNPYGSLELLYRGSRDGLETAVFHQLCDGKGPTLSIFKSTEGYVFGGFNGASWASDCSWLHCTEASLFTLRNPHQVPPQWFPIKDKTQATVFNSPAHGPSFARFSSGGLKKINVADISEFGATFHDATGKGDTLFTGKTHCSLIDIEVFSVKPEAA